MIKFKNIFLKLRDAVASMRLRFVLLILFGSALALASYLICHSATYFYVNNVYTSTEERIERELSYVEDLQDYITERGITYDRVDEISDWVRQNRFVYLLIYKDDEIIFRPDENEPEDEGGNGEMGDETGDGTEDGENENPNEGEGGDTEGDETPQEPPKGGNTGSPSQGGSGLTITYPTKAELYEYALSGENYPLILEDGALFCSLAEFTEYLYYDIANISSLVIAIIVLAGVLITYFYTVTSRISRLARDVSTVSHGSMNHVIRAGGSHDEIAKLCRNVEYMRSSIVYTLQKEREAVNANVELITSMSHDIRTPLTVLLGYLDIMKMQTQDEAMLQYISSAEQTAVRLKNLSDEMFQYFLVFSGEQSRTMCEPYDVKTLLPQLFAEHYVLLTEYGFALEAHFDEDIFASSPVIVTNAPGCMRIVDNLFSNMRKYAEPTCPIHFYLSEDDGFVYVRIENKIRDNTEDVESTGIGLKTCERIAKNIGMKFEAKTDEDTFVVSIAIPKQKEEEK